MTWEIAFIIVGCTWAFVVLYTARNRNEREMQEEINRLHASHLTHEKEINWLREVYLNVMRTK